VKITLASHVVTFEPPQRLLMLEATRENGGERVRILHASGHEEEEGNFRLVGRSQLAPSLPDEAAGEAEAVALPSELFTGLPLLAELDIWDPPAQYRTLPEAAKGRFDFHRGERYAVVILTGETLADVKVVAQ
jgi:hypothetical protein